MACIGLGIGVIRGDDVPADFRTRGVNSVTGETVLPITRLGPLQVSQARSRATQSGRPVIEELEAIVDIPPNEFIEQVSLELGLAPDSDLRHCPVSTGFRGALVQRMRCLAMYVGLGRIRCRRCDLYRSLRSRAACPLFEPLAGACRVVNASQRIWRVAESPGG